MRLVAAATDLTALHDELFAAYPDEAAAFLSVVPQNDTLALRAFRVFHAHEVERSGGGVSILEEVKVREIAKLKKAGLALVAAHTHPDVDQGVDERQSSLLQLGNFSDLDFQEYR